MPACRPVAAILAAALTFLLAPAAAQARQSPSPMVDKINKVRRAHGIRALRYSPSLSGSSAAFAGYLAATQRFAHGSRINASGRFSQLGEILALMRGWKVRRNRTLRYWLQSPSHRGVLLSSAFRYVGAARSRGTFGGTPSLVWTVQFGR